MASERSPSFRELTRRTTFADDLDDWVLGPWDVGGFFDPDDAEEDSEEEEEADE